MYYNNYSQDAVMELERQRLDSYLDKYCVTESEEKSCEECGTYSKKLHYINSHWLCEDCICDSLREVYASINQDITVFNIDAIEILKDIIADFSDSELMCYVENRYETEC